MIPWLAEMLDGEENGAVVALANHRGTVVDVVSRLVEEGKIEPRGSNKTGGHHEVGNV